MTVNETHRADRRMMSTLIRRYGKVLTDDDMVVVNAKGTHDYVRVTIFAYGGKVFYHKLVNGKVADLQIIGDETEVVAYEETLDIDLDI